MENKVQKTVLVTGFGPFRNYEVNPSWSAVKLLPKLFSEWEKSSDFNLIIEEIPVAYRQVSKGIKELWEKHKPSVSRNSYLAKKNFHLFVKLKVAKKRQK